MDGSSAPGKRKVYRVHGIPEGTQDATEAAGFLIARLDESCGIEVHTLARDPSSTSAQRTLVATVSFSKTPGFITSRPNHKQERWTLEGPTSLRFDLHFLGITPLKTAVSSDKSKIFCIAIPGLSGHGFGSWKARDGPYMWLRDSLSVDIPQVQVLLYGYESTLVGSHSFQGIDDIARSLRKTLQDIVTVTERETGILPVFHFVSHSLGGLILKQAIVQMKESSPHSGIDKKVLMLIYGIIFFGVPHRGIQVKQWKQMVDGQPNERLVEELRPDSPYLSNLATQFQQAFTYDDSKVVAFYETEETQSAVRTEDGRWTPSGAHIPLVATDSATNSCRQEYEAWPINRNHQDMVKFSDSWDEYYKQVLSVLFYFQSEPAKVIWKRIIQSRPELPSKLLPDNERPSKDGYPGESVGTQSTTRQILKNFTPKAFSTFKKISNNNNQHHPPGPLEPSPTDARHPIPDSHIEKLEFALKHQRTFRTTGGESVGKETRLTPYEQKDMENRLDRIAYGQEREGKMMQQKALRMDSIQGLGRLHSMDGVYIPQAHIIGQLTTIDLNFDSAVSILFPGTEDPWLCDVAVSIDANKDGKGKAHSITLRRREGYGVITDFIPTGYGSVPHTEPANESEGWYHRVEFLNPHQFVVRDRRGPHEYSHRPQYDFTNADDAKAFQERVFGKELLLSVPVKEIVSNKDEECRRQHLRVWKTQQTLSIQFNATSRKRKNTKGYWEVEARLLKPESPTKPGTRLKLYVRAEEAKKFYLEIFFEKEQDQLRFLFICYPEVLDDPKSPKLRAMSSSTANTPKPRPSAWGFMRKKSNAVDEWAKEGGNTV